MKFIFKNKKIIFFLAVFVFVAGGTSIFMINKVISSSPAPISGYAWSSTIGWISMSGTGYGVELNASDQNLSGYAWSPNIGWIQFGGLTGFPSGPGTISANAKYDTVNNKLIGWAKAIAADNNGWDGWISLSGTGYDVNVNSTSGNFSGLAWGSNVVGWVDFSGVEGDVVSNDGACSTFGGQTHLYVLTSISSLCDTGVVDGNVTEATTTDTSDPADPLDVDYYYSWTCKSSVVGGNPSPLCHITTESINFPDGQVQPIVARLKPAIVKTKSDYCTVLWTTPSDMVCHVEKSSSGHTDANTSSDGHQVEIGDNYQVVCKDSATQNIITAKSQLLKCVLNPSVREI